jgi:hypothetical protein
MPSTRCAVATSATAKSYRDAVCTVGGNPDATAPARTYVTRSSIVASEIASDGDIVIVNIKTRVSPSTVNPVNPSAIANTTKKRRILMAGVTCSSSLSVVQKEKAGRFLSLDFPLL